MTVPQAQFLKLKIPDPELRWDEAAQHYRIGAIDWKEFQRVVKGEGPCNRQRLESRRRAHEEGRWVREAASAYALKARQRVGAEE